MPFKVVSDSLVLINLLVTVVAMVIVGVALVGLVKRTVLNALNEVNKALEVKNVVLEKEKQAQQQRLEAVESGAKMADKRLLRMEIDSQKNKRLYDTIREENRMLETVVSIALQCLSLIDANQFGVQRIRIEDIMRDLRDFRMNAARDLDDWENEQMLLLIHMMPETARRESLKGRDNER